MFANTAILLRNYLPNGASQEKSEPLQLSLNDRKVSKASVVTTTRPTVETKATGVLPSLSSQAPSAEQIRGRSGLPVASRGLLSDNHLLAERVHATQHFSLPAKALATCGSERFLPTVSANSAR